MDLRMNHQDEENLILNHWVSKLVTSFEIVQYYLHS